MAPGTSLHVAALFSLMVRKGSMIGTLTGDVQVTCGDCAAMFLIRPEVMVNLLPVKFCPICGTANLTQRKVVLSEILKAKVFSDADVDPILVQMLYSEWASIENNKLAWPRFVDYVQFQLEHGEI